MIWPVRSTAQQVTGLIVLSLLAAHAVLFGLVMLAFNHQPQPLRQLERGPGLAAIARLYGAEPTSRAAILSAAARVGLALREISSTEAATCVPAHRPAIFMPFLHWPHGEPAFIHCDPTRKNPLEGVIRVNDTLWLGLVRGPGGFALPPPPPAILPWQLAGLVLSIGFPTLVLTLFASRRVIAPLQRLAEMADRIDVEHQSAALPVEGTIEISRLAESFNRLILRLRRFVTDQRRMIAGISHDLRTPLTRLRLRVDLIPDADLRAKMLRDIEAMQIIVESSLSLISAQENGFVKTPVDVAVLLQTIADGYIDAGADVRFSGVVHLTVPCAPSMLTRAIENIVDNAIKFSGSAEISLACNDDTAIIDITDHGPGLSDGDKAAVFEPFYRADASRGQTQGHGLGLSITRAVVESHGGTISLRDAQPHGLCVEIRLKRH